MVASVEDRLWTLERDLASLAARLDRVERGLGAKAAPKPMFAPAPSPPPTSAWQRPPKPVVAAPAPSRAPERDRRDLEEILGGRLLALVGAVAVLVGLVFLVALAIDRGWIDERARVALAFLGSGGLLAVGVWLHEARGRTQASLAMAGTGIAGLFLSLTAASALYALVPSAVALAGAFAVGAVGATLAVRWESRTLAAIALLGALGAPVLVGSFPSLEAVAFLAVALAAAAAVLVWQRWEWLRIAAFAVATSQVAVWAAAEEPGPALVVGVLTVFGLLNLAGALGYELRVPPVFLRPSTSLLVAANALAIGGIGYAALVGDEGPRAAGAWLAGLAAAHLAAGIGLLAIRRGSRNVGFLLLGVALTAADVAFALLVDGQLLAIGWAASAAALAALGRRLSADENLLQTGLAAQLALAIGHTLLFDAPPGAFVDGGSVAFAPLAAIAVSAFTCARLARDGRVPSSGAADATALVALAYLTAHALDGVPLVLAWTGQAVVLGQLASRGRDLVAWGGAFGFLALAAGHALGFEAQPDSLVYGVESLPAAALALAAVGGAAIRLARLDPEVRPVLDVAGGALAVYLASVAIVTAFQPGPDALDAGLGLDVRQQGQALLSAFWSVLGLALLSIGLRRDVRVVRLAGFALLAVAVVKVFVFDMAALDAGYRVLSFVVLGLFLLAGAYAYQRMRRGRSAASAAP